VGGEVTLSPGREAGGGVADAAAEPSSDQASRPAVEACVFRTGTALSMSLSCSRSLALRVLKLRVLCSAPRPVPVHSLVPEGLGWRHFKQGPLNKLKLGVLE